MRHRFPVLRAPTSAITTTMAMTMTIALLAGCASTPNRWVLIEPHAPSRQATAVGTGTGGAAWFFQCDEQAMTAGLRVGPIEAAEGQERQISIKFDAEPAEQSLWRVQRSTYVLRGNDAIALARRAALAYDAVVGIDGSHINFSLTGSHVALIGMTRSCPFLDVR